MVDVAKVRFGSEARKMNHRGISGSAEVLPDEPHKSLFVRRRLCARYRRLIARGKPATLKVTAIARELAAFVWAIARIVTPNARPAAAAVC